MAGAAEQSRVVSRHLTAVIKWVEQEGNDSLELQKIKDAAHCLIQKSKLAREYSYVISEAEELAIHTRLAAPGMDLESHADSTSMLSQPLKKKQGTGQAQICIRADQASLG